MQQFAWEEYDLVLPWNDGLIAAFADVISLFQPRVVNTQFTPFELPRLVMKEIDERQLPGGYPIAAVIAVEAEKVSVIAGSNLHLPIDDGKFLHPEFLQHARKNVLDALQKQILKVSQIRQYSRPAMFIVDDAAICHRRNHFTSPKIGLVFERETRQFFKFLWRKKFV